MVLFDLEQNEPMQGAVDGTGAHDSSVLFQGSPHPAEQRAGPGENGQKTLHVNPTHPLSEVLTP